MFSVRPSVRQLSVNTYMYISRDAVSLYLLEILMKLGINIRHVSRHC